MIGFHENYVRTVFAHELMPEAQIGCMVLAMPTYPLTPNPDDVIAAMEAERKNYFFFDVHIRGVYLGYMKRFFHENAIELDFGPEDEELVKNTDESKRVSNGGNILGGIANPYLEASEWGWQN